MRLWMKFSTNDGMKATPLGGGCDQYERASLPGRRQRPFLPSARMATRAPPYDDIDDYHGLNQSPPQNSAGVDMPGYAGFTRNVTGVQPAGAWNTIAAADVRLITVSVTSPSNESLAISAYRVNF